MRLIFESAVQQQFCVGFHADQTIEALNRFKGVCNT